MSRKELTAVSHRWAIPAQKGDVIGGVGPDLCGRAGFVAGAATDTE
jgi:hypothetical protein